ncbi:MAG: glutamine--fructose-6-phosphate transaminase (isomerizing), partial [bacterium]
MCGIAGYTGPRPAVPILLNGLAKLEYRGYDSAGLAVLNPMGKMRVLKKAGKIENLAKAVKNAGLDASLHFGIGHTRWATHGHPTDQNAHPHTDCGGTVAVVHNGIIENYQKLKKELLARGHRFKSQTDSEVLAHLIEEGLQKRPWAEAVRWALSQVTGTYSILAACGQAPGILIAARLGGGALVVGVGENENFVASDVPALLEHTQKVYYLDDDEMAVVAPDGNRILGIRDGKPRKKEASKIAWTVAQAEKGGHPHFMLKEILEQPRALEDTQRGRLDPKSGEVFLEGGFQRAPWVKSFKKITILACGTSYYAGLVGKFILEEHLKVPVEVDYASEFRYRDPVINKNHLVIVITQSGETVDTLVALREARLKGAKVVVVCNVMGSSATREADAVLLTRAGPEIGVASTKAFTTQLEALWLLTLFFAQARRTLPIKFLRAKGKALARVPALAAAALKQRKKIEKIARIFANHYNFLYLGRGINYPIALEGALKLKEISYIHA